MQYLADPGFDLQVPEDVVPPPEEELLDGFDELTQIPSLLHTRPLIHSLSFSHHPSPALHGPHTCGSQYPFLGGVNRQPPELLDGFDDLTQ
jgi:hypothetical protein